MYQGIALISLQIIGDQQRPGAAAGFRTGGGIHYLDSKSGHFDNAGNKINLQTTTCKYLLIEPLSKRLGLLAKSRAAGRD